MTKKLCNFMGVLNSIDTAFLLIMLKIKQRIFTLQFCETYNEYLVQEQKVDSNSDQVP